MWKKIATVVMAWCLAHAALAIASTSGSSANKALGKTSEHTMEMAAQIKGVLDGEQYEWFVLSHGSDSNASFVESGDHITIDITGFIDDEVWEAQESLSISLTVNDEQLTGATVLHPLGDTTSPPLYTSERGDVTVTLTRVERSSRRVHVAGKIQGLLALQVELGEPPSREEGIEIDVVFDVEAQKIEF
jgi:hypothetical protein